jgi:hypothetical protein
MMPKSEAFSGDIVRLCVKRSVRLHIAGAAIQRYLPRVNTAGETPPTAHFSATIR